jgi:hypothetical protein
MSAERDIKLHHSDKSSRVQRPLRLLSHVQNVAVQTTRAPQALGLLYPPCTTIQRPSDLQLSSVASRTQISTVSWHTSNQRRTLSPASTTATCSPTSSVVPAPRETDKWYSPAPAAHRARESRGATRAATAAGAAGRPAPRAHRRARGYVGAAVARCGAQREYRRRLYD